MKPFFYKKSLGQHFLTSPQVIESLCDAGHVMSGDTVIEIGPGKGALTRALLRRQARVLALEKDETLIPYLSETFATEIASGQLQVICTSAETYSLDESITEPYKVIANIPYNLTGLLLRHFLGAQIQPTLLVFLMQYEVVSRITAPDNKTNLLELSVTAYGTPRMVSKVKKGAFYPPPEVTSAILCVSDISRKRFTNSEHERLFFEVIKTAFAHKRKFAYNNLLAIYDESLIHDAWHEHVGDFKKRAEDISLETWLSFTQVLVL